MKNDHLILFVKNPELGKTKTRIAVSTGDQKALEIYKELVEITRNVAEKTNCQKHLFYSEFIDCQDNWDSSIFLKNYQVGVNLGERMKNAFQKVFEANTGKGKLIIIGSDCPYIDSELISSAFAALDEYQTVIGPATDGGYYLLGMSEYFPEIFDDIAWSSDTVFSDTIKILDTKKLSYHTLTALTDIDTIDDWEEYKNGK